MFNDTISILLYLLTMALLYLSLYGKSVKIKKLENEVNSLKKRL
ncbi:hypothetical protein ACQUFT_00390 [Mammaliicoccus lentus]|nr:hypothetical protein [Mammaliicoccus lentus]WGZ43532.1 hypothetical protein PN942_01065 [Mammaliicoccus lentus]SUM52103.1 Uncharacterised protein [Mammaliicoccus lentus]